MKIIGLVGYIGSGKDTVSDYIQQKYGYREISFGDTVRKFAAITGKTHSRDDLQQVAREFRAKYGKDFFGREIVKKIKASGRKKILLNGIRRPEDIMPVKEAFGEDFLLVFVDCDAKTRFERMRMRKRVSDPKTFQEFQRQEKNEFKLFDFDGVIAQVRYRIDNNHEVKQLYRNIDKFIKDNSLQ